MGGVRLNLKAVGSSLLIFCVGFVAGMGTVEMNKADSEVVDEAVDSSQERTDWELKIKDKENEVEDYRELLAEANAKISSLELLLSPTPTSVPKESSEKEDLKKVAGAKANSSSSNEVLMEAINNFRRDYGLSGLVLHEGLCELADMRFDQVKSSGNLDNHSGFNNYFTQKAVSELKGASLSYVSENLAQGYGSEKDTVWGWNGSEDHRKMLTQGVYKYGCARYDDGFAVLIGGY